MPAKKQTQQQYQTAYTRLSQIASELESGESSLDQVLPLLQEAQEAYAVCQERLQALRTVLESGPSTGAAQE